MYRNTNDLPVEIQETFSADGQKRFKSVYNRESAKNQPETLAFLKAYNEAVKTETGKSIDLDQYSDSDGIIEGLGIPYGGRLQFEQRDGTVAGRDFDGEYFDEATDYTSDIYDGKALTKTMPVLYDHGLDDTLKGSVIGEVKSIEDTEKGKWFTIQLNRAHEYYKYLLYLAKCGALSLSTGAKSALKALDGHIDRWELQEISLTPSACNPMAQIAIKSIQFLGDNSRMDKNDIAAEVVAMEDLEEPEKKAEDPVEDAEATEQEAAEASEGAPVEDPEKACEKAKWDEDKHPRANNGQFSSTPGGGPSASDKPKEGDKKPKEEKPASEAPKEPGEGTNPNQSEQEEALHSALANGDREAVAAELGKLPQGTVMTSTLPNNDLRIIRQEGGWSMQTDTGSVDNLTDEIVARVLADDDRFIIQNSNPGKPAEEKPENDGKPTHEEMAVGLRNEIGADQYVSRETVVDSAGDRGRVGSALEVALGETETFAREQYRLNDEDAFIAARMNTPDILRNYLETARREGVLDRETIQGATNWGNNYMDPRDVEDIVSNYVPKRDEETSYSDVEDKLDSMPRSFWRDKEELEEDLREAGLEPTYIDNESLYISDPENEDQELGFRLTSANGTIEISGRKKSTKKDNMDKKQKACDKAEEATPQELLANLEEAWRAAGQYLTNMKPDAEPQKAEDDDETIVELADNAEHDVDEALADEHHGHADEAEHDEVDADEEIEKLRDEIDDIKEQLALEAEKKKAVELENIELRKGLEDCTKRLDAIEHRMTEKVVLHPVANPKFGDVPQTRSNLEELANNKNFSPSTRYELSRAAVADEIADLMRVDR